MNKKAASRTITVDILTRRYDGLASLTCVTCQATLDMIQPDPMQTDRFLATCSECGNWSLVQHRDHNATVVLVSLDPVAAEIGRAKARHGAES